MDDTATSAVQTRSLAELLVKTLTVHIVTTANYAYLHKLQHRSIEDNYGVLRVAFFILTPTIAILELAVGVLLALVNFARDEANEYGTSLRFFLSAAMGMFASQKKSDDDEAASQARGRVSLLSLSCNKFDRGTLPIDWSWAGGMLIALFALAQGTGTIVVWAQRLVPGNMLNLDDRNGLMGIVTTLFSIQTLLILLTRSKWTVNQPVQNDSRSTDSEKHRRIFMRYAVAALVLQDFARTENFRGRRFVGHNPSILVWLILNNIHYMGSLPFMMLAVFLLIMRNEIIEKFGLASLRDTMSTRLDGKQEANVKLSFRQLQVLARVLLTVLITSDIIAKIVDDVLQLVDSLDMDEYWLQTPLGEKIPVL